jgi:putative protease
MAEKPVGQVTHYYDHIGVAVLQLTDAIRVGDELRFRGHTTDFKQVLGSLQIEHEPVESAGPGDDVAAKVDQPVRAGDTVFRIDRLG